MAGWSEGRNKRTLWLYGAFSAVVLFFLAMPVYSEFVIGASRQYLSQPYLWRDAAELAVYFFVLLLVTKLAKGKKGVVAIAVSAVYLLSTGTLSQCLASYVYIEILLCIGQSVLALLFPKERKYSTGARFLAGSVVWGSMAIAMSLLHMGTIGELRVLTVVLTLLAIINPKFKMDYTEILAVKYARYLNQGKGTEFLMNAFFILVMWIACARVNTHLEFDSFWYALYPEKCLFGENSFYEFLGYTDFVYYYPKFKELLMAPISALGLPGYLISANLWIMLIAAVEVYGFLERRIRGSRIQILCVVFLMFSSVCIVGIAGTAKSDAISYLYLLMLVIYGIEYFQAKEQYSFWIALTAGVMSYTVKYTNFLFSTIVLALLFFRLLHLFFREGHKVEKPLWAGVVLVLAAGLVLAGILYRTCMLTGYPTYREAKGVWDVLGFQGKPYFDAEIMDKPESVFEPGRIYEAFFDVGKLDKLSIAWTGNYSVFFGMCLLGIYRKRQKSKDKLLQAIALALASVSLYLLVTMASPDGNYFSVSIIVVTCCLLVRMTASACWESNKRWFTVIAGAFMVLNLMFVFITHPSRQPGTRIWGRDVSMIMTEAEKQETYELELKSLGVYEINERLKQTDGNDFIMADGWDTRMSMLNARIEIAGGFFQRYLSAAGVEIYKDFVEYAKYVGVDGFVIAKEVGVEPFRAYVTQYLEEYGYIEVVETEKYMYYKVR